MTAQEYLEGSEKLLHTKNPDWFNFFITAYYELDEYNYLVLINLLKSYFSKYTNLWKSIEDTRENVAYYVLSRTIEDWLENSDDSFITFLQLRKNYLNNYLGYGLSVFREYLKDNASEFDVEYFDHYEGYNSVLKRKE